LRSDESKSEHEMREILDKIFNNITDVRDFTSNFVSALEDTLEMRRDDSQPLIGACFVEMAQVYVSITWHTVENERGNLFRAMNLTCIEPILRML